MTELAQINYGGLKEVFGEGIPVGQQSEIDVDVLRSFTYRLSHVEETEGEHKVVVCRVQSSGNGAVLTPIMDLLDLPCGSKLTAVEDAFDRLAPFPISPAIFMRQLLQQAKFIRTGSM